MPFGTILLAAYNKEDVLLTSNPTITFFKRVYRRHTMFSTESRLQYFSSTPDFGLSCSCVIAMNGDLLGNTYVQIELPAINVPKSSNSWVNRFSRFRFVDYPGFAIIKSVSLEINGKVLCVFDGAYMYTQYELACLNNNGNQRNHRRGICQLVGHTKQLTSYSQSKPRTSMTIPIPFYYTKDSASFLPLISLYRSEVRIGVQLETLQNLIVYGPMYCVHIKENGYFIDTGTDDTIRFTIPGSALDDKQIEVFGFDIVGKCLYFNLLGTTRLSDLAVGAVLSDRLGNVITINSTVTATNMNTGFVGVIPRSQILCDYIFLSNRERKLFYTNEHYYLVEQVSVIRQPQVTSNYNLVKIGLSCVATEIIIVGALRVWKVDKSCFQYLTPDSPNEPLIRSVGLTVCGNPIIPLQDSFLTQYVTNLCSHTASSPAHGIHTIPFSQSPERLGLGGHLNMSQYDDIQLSFTTRSDINVTKPAMVTIYVRSINIIHIHDGIAETVFTH